MFLVQASYRRLEKRRRLHAFSHLGALRFQLLYSAPTCVMSWCGVENDQEQGSDIFYSFYRTQAQ